MNKILYFAYGSNVSCSTMKLRCPSSKIISEGILDDYILLDKKELPFLSIVKSKGDIIKGTIYEITKKDLKNLDICEGYPDVYDRIKVKINSNNNLMKCYCYIISNKMLNL